MEGPSSTVNQSEAILNENSTVASKKLAKKIGSRNFCGSGPRNVRDANFGEQYPIG